MPVNYRQIKAIEKENKERILAICPTMPDRSGIYIFTREEDGIRYAYVGKAKHLLTRASQHLKGYPQRIDKSIKKHGLWSEKNPVGYRVGFLEFPDPVLNEKERYYIQAYQEQGYEMRNVESGGQKGKTDIGERKPAKGYHDGLRQGYKNAQKEVAHLFDKHLTFAQKSPKPNKLQARAAEKFRVFLSVDNKSEE